MQTSQSTKEITKAIIAVMKEVKGIDKSMTVGTGSNAYKGVSDKDVKTVIGKSMENNGLCLIPVEVEPTLQIDRWTETGGQYGDKQKQSVFATVKTKYLLLHESGEWIEVSGYGHGTDSQDKAAGKATTYALKYAMLYTFMVPTGKIDDADAAHSDEIETPKAGQNGKTNSYNRNELSKPGLPLITNKLFKDAMDRINKGEFDLIAKLEKTYSFDAAQKSILDSKKQPA